MIIIPMITEKYTFAEPPDVESNNPISAGVELIFNCTKLMYIAATSVSINYVATYTVNTGVAKLRCYATCNPIRPAAVH